MVRVHSQWSETYPDLNFMMQQNLRHKVAQLRRKIRQVEEAISSSTTAPETPEASHNLARLTSPGHTATGTEHSNLCSI